MPKFVEVVFDIPLDKSFAYKNPEGLDAKIGTRVKAIFNNRPTKAWVVSSSDTADYDEAKIKEYLSIVDEEPIFGNETLKLAKWMAGMYFCSLGIALNAMLPKAGEESKKNNDSFEESEISKKALIPSQEQKAALEAICSQKDGIWYLYGPTGTGKTEVFLESAEATLKEGRGVIYLVPEIALTTQVIEAVKERFGSLCAVIHSGLTAKRKLHEWKRIQRGEARVVVGARSAIFAPVSNLGLIVLDEEHENSYKAGSSPRYNARQVAIKRSIEEKTRLVMGSATPSIEAWSQIQQGKIVSLKLSKRLAGGEMPQIEIVDMRTEKSAFSKKLIEEIRNIKKQDGQTILFLNRRGFSYFWSCHSCGAELKCRNCSVGLTYHKEKNRLVCHYCGYQAPPPKACPVCGSFDTGWAGFGTEQIEEEAQKLFPELKIARIDTDSVKNKGVLDCTLKDFYDGKIDILLGTQMVAKGLNFPKVKLVGIILADTSLNLPDFRASERTWSLVTQVAGRAGRFIKGGKVIIQTYRPTSSTLRYAMNHDAQGFYNDELWMRKETNFPPFSRLLRIVVRSKEEELTYQIAAELTGRIASCISLSNFSPSEVEILGPSECPIAVVSGNHRIQILLRSKSPSSGRAILYASIKDWKTPSSVYIEIDPDPVSLL